MSTSLGDLEQRARQAPAWLVDAALIAAIGFLTMMDAWWNEPGTQQADAITYALAVTSVVALVARRRMPLVVALMCGLAFTGLYVRGHHGELLNLPSMVALYTVATQGSRRRTLAVGLVAVVWSGVLGYTSDDPIGARGGSPILEMLVPVVPLLLGEIVRSRRELAAHAAAEQEREATRRVEAERTRMARELHDVLAHTLAAVNVQTAVAEAALDRDPELARESLGQARSSGKAALAELRATLYLLRDGPGIAPAPGVDQIDDLLGAARAAGVEVTADIHVSTSLPAGVGLATYRIVQEAVTNTIRHSDARHLAVSVETTDAVVRVEVVDDGRAGDGTASPDGGPPTRNGGLGLVGMRERILALDGQLTHGPVRGTGYRVVAVIPIVGGEAP